MSRNVRYTAAVTVDLVVLTIRSDELSALVVKRALTPFKGRWALPGGFVRAGEGLAEAASREFGEETGLSGVPVHLEQLASYGEPRRDPRGRVVTVAYLALAPDLPTPQSGGESAAATWTPVAELLADPKRLAFDHHRVLIDGVERARAKLEYTPLGAAFCHEEFTIADLRRVYEVVWGAQLDPRNFHRKVTGTPGFVIPTQRRTTQDGGRPARLYKKGEARVLYPPLLRRNPVEDLR